MLRQAAARRELAAPLAQVGEAQDRIDEIVVGRELERVDAGVGERRAQLLPRASRPAAAKRLRKPRSCVSTKSCSPVSASCITTQPEVGQLHLERIVEPHGDDLVPLREMRERLGPARRADEIGHDEHQRAPRHDVRAPRAAERRRSVGADCGSSGRVSICVQDVQHVAPAAARRDHRIHAVAVEQRADAVAVARQQARQHGRRTRSTTAALLHVARAEVHRRAQVEQEPRGDFAVLVVTRARTASAAAR